MHKFHYRPGKSAFAGLIAGSIALWAGWVWVTSPDSTWLSASLALLCAAAALKVAMDAMSDTPALAFDSSSIRVRRTWGQVEEIAWEEVQTIGVEVYTLRYWGIIPISRTKNLVVKCAGGLFGSRRLRLALKMMELPAGGAGQLLAMLDAAHVAAVGETAVAMAGADRQHGWGSRSAALPVSPRGAEQTAAEDFDADAAIARYLARKESEAASPATPSPAPVPPSMPQRPTFGRKTQAG